DDAVRILEELVKDFPDIFIDDPRHGVDAMYSVLMDATNPICQYKSHSRLECCPKWYQDKYGHLCSDQPEKLGIVYNTCYGGFGLSDAAKKLYEELSGHKYKWNICRHDPHLVEVVKRLGKFADSKYSNLKICYLNK